MQMTKKAVRNMIVRAIERCEEILDQNITDHDDTEHADDQDEVLRAFQARIVSENNAVSQKLVLLQSILAALDEQEKAEQASYAQQETLILSILKSLE